MDRIQRVMNYFLSKASVKVVLNIRGFFGLYYNCGSNNIIKVCFRIYCIIYVLLIGLSIFITFSAKTILYLPVIYLSLEFFLNILISFFSQELYYLNFFSALTVFDEDFEYRNNFLSCRPYVFGIGMLLLKLSTIAYNIPMSRLTIPQGLCAGFLAMSCGMSYFPIYMVLDSIRTRMTLQQKELSSTEEASETLQEETIRNKILHVRKCVRSYNRLYDNLQANDGSLHVLLSSLILMNFPKLVLYLYRIIKSYTLGLPEKMFPALGGFINTIAYISIPSIFVELITEEVGKIQQNLMLELANCSDEELKTEIELALEYFELRPFRLVVFRIFRVDASLPINYLSLCITYTIVLVQFLNFKE